VNNIVTGYVWQTGVMRRDFELYGSTLFVDRLGRPLNNKGWPLMTLAMLSEEKKVCLASEAIVFSERVSAYACVIAETVDMTPGVDLADVKVIYGDGILGGGGLLRDLEISATCNIILDHQHLLSEDIGPKKIGKTWPQIKDDCTDLVKSYDENIYNSCLNRVSEITSPTSVQSIRKVYVRTKFVRIDYARNNKRKTTKQTKQAIVIILHF
jgi:hypothetical protein